MHLTRRPRATGALLTLGLFCALLGPGAAGRAAAAADASGSLQAGPRIGLEQALVRDRAGRLVVAHAGTRDDRERPGSALPAALALAVAAAVTVAAARRPGRPPARQAVATAARAPPPLRPATS
jgi:hypothetical protein